MIGSGVQFQRGRNQYLLFLTGTDRHY